MVVFLPLVGILVLLALAYLLSKDRRSIRLRTVGPAFALQAGFAAFVLYTDIGVSMLDAVVGGAQHFINYANAGIGFIFGPLADPSNFGFVFAFSVLPVIVFIAALTSTLYHLGIMQRVVGALGGALKVITGTSRAESTCAAANIFIGQTESPLFIKPYIARMTQSELFAVMTGGLASVAGSVMFGYAAMGVELKYLIAASFMAAPGGLFMAKMIVPEVETPEETTQIVYDEENPPVNLVDAIASGAMSGASLAVAIGALLLAFIALIAMVNGIFGGLGSLVGIENLTLENALGWIFAPMAFLLGVPWEEAVPAASLIGQKLVLNEFVAFVNFTAPDAPQLSEHAKAVTTFALCGFANLSSIAILMGGLGGLAPSRRADVARMGLRAVAAGSLSNMMSAALASFFLLI